MSKPFTPIVPANIPASPLAPQPSAAHASHPQPRVTLKRDGDRVTHIIVHCMCGQTIELACEY